MLDLSEIGNPGTDITEIEARCLAHRLAARFLLTEWLDWEDLPSLTERAMQLVNEQVADIAADLFKRSRQLDHNYQVDSAYLLEQAEG